MLIALAIGAVAAFASYRWLGRNRPVGAVLVVVAAWLFSQPILAGAETWLAAAAAGAGIGFLLPWRGERARRAGVTRLTAAVCIVAMSGLTAWIGANSATVGWFGALTYHGPRTGREVAVTFDDGPDITYTPAVMKILDAYGVKATFFSVGRALDARPDISRALLDDGQLLGNHSYFHDYWRWLDPGYAELDRTQRAFERDLGVCPTFFRPPHGQHTPLMAWQVGHDGMTMVTWDDSTNDWQSHDGVGVADRILAKVRPGSIIDLHDGLDGKVSADRSVLLTALPRILDGLRARGLKPVRLDQLLGKPAYVRCPSPGSGDAVLSTRSAG